jgi:hypothetical protein
MQVPALGSWHLASVTAGCLASAGRNVVVKFDASRAAELNRVLRIGRRNRWEGLLPRPRLTCLDHRRFEIAAPPIGWKPKAGREAETR